MDKKVRASQGPGGEEKAFGHFLGSLEGLWSFFVSDYSAG